MEINIYNSKPRKVICVGNEDNNFFDCDENSQLLTVSNTYNLIYVEVHSWHTIVWLDEFPGVEFNSCCFEEMEE